MLPDHYNAPMDIIADLAVRETDHAITLPLQPSLAFDVSELNFLKPLVHAAVNLDDEALGVAGEVSEAAAYRSLATEVHVQLTQLIPRPLLRPSHPALQAPGPRSRRRGLSHVSEHHAFPPCWAT
jgi:hypothetical protein